MKAGTAGSQREPSAVASQGCQGEVSILSVQGAQLRLVLALVERAELDFLRPWPLYVSAHLPTEPPRPTIPALGHSRLHSGIFCGKPFQRAKLAQVPPLGPQNAFP